MASTTRTTARDGLDSRIAPTWRPVDLASGYPSFAAVVQRDELAGADARRMLAAVLRGWGLLDMKDELNLVATELVSNAAKHARGDVIRVHLTRTGARRVRVAVTDRSRQQPELRAVQDLDESGRGLHMVQAVASRVGVTPMPWGKSVWAEVGVA